MPSTPVRLPLLALVALILVMAPTPTAAQGTTGQDTVPIRDLVVRALRTPLAIWQIPYGVDAIGTDRLSAGTTGSSIAEALRGIPGVQLQNRYNFAVGERIAVRGFGVRAQFGVRGLSATVDGVPATMPDGQTTLDHVDPGQLRRAEVVPGPASALWGNAAGGIVRLETLTPVPGPFRAEVDAMGGSDGLSRYSGTATGSSGRVAYAVGLTEIGWDGFRPNPRTEGGTYGEATRRHLGARMLVDTESGVVNAVISGLDLDSENPSGIGQAFLTDGVRDAHSFSVLQGTGKEVQQLQFGLGWTGELDGGRTAEIGGWLLGRDLTNPIPSAIIGLDRRAGGVRGLLSGDLAMAGRDWAWTAGAEFGLQADTRKNWANERGERGALTLDQDERVRDFAGFVQLRSRLSPSVLVSVGARADRVSFDFTPRRGGAFEFGTRSMSSFSPTFAVLFDASPTAQLYANVGTSFETPTTTELVNRPGGGAGLNPELDPAEGFSREVGARMLVGDGASIELRGFMVSLTNELVPFEDASAPGRTFFRNVGESSHHGVEASARAELGPGLSGRASWSWTDAEFDEFTVDATDFSGNLIPGLAPQRAEVALTIDRGPGFVEIREEYVDRIATNDNNSVFAPSYFLTDIRAELDPIDVGGTRWAPYAGITNLFDERYVASVVPNAFGDRYYEPGPERSFYIGARVGLLGG